MRLWMEYGEIIREDMSNVCRFSKNWSLHEIKEFILMHPLTFNLLMFGHFSVRFARISWVISCNLLNWGWLETLSNVARLSLEHFCLQIPLHISVWKSILLIIEKAFLERDCLDIGNSSHSFSNWCKGIGMRRKKSLTRFLWEHPNLTASITCSLCKRKKLFLKFWELEIYPQIYRLATISMDPIIELKSSYDSKWCVLYILIFNCCFENNK